MAHAISIDSQIKPLRNAEGLATTKRAPWGDRSRTMQSITDELLLKTIFAPFNRL
jgi:hypothetical protein